MASWFGRLEEEQESWSSSRSPSRSLISHLVSTTSPPGEDPAPWGSRGEGRALELENKKDSVPVWLDSLESTDPDPFTRQNDDGREYKIRSKSARESSFTRSSEEEQQEQDLFEEISYHDTDIVQREQLEKLLENESSWRRSCLHKGLVANTLFFILFLIGALIVEFQYPLEGINGTAVPLINDSKCLNQSAACYTVRIIRSIGLFGLAGGMSNWFAVEMLFRSIPLLFGTGVIVKHYREISSTLHHKVIMETLFDKVALKHYFSEKSQTMNELLCVDARVGGLLNSTAANQIIEQKIESALKRPEGFVLVLMGVDLSQLGRIIRRHVEAFIQEISPLVLEKVAGAGTGLTDGAELQSEMGSILERKIQELSSKKVKQLVAAMIRKHLSWVILWGCIMGACIGLAAEMLAIVLNQNSIVF